jgi:hypothetical protein
MAFGMNKPPVTIGGNKPAAGAYPVPPGARAVLDRAAALFERRRVALQVDTGRAEADAAAEAALERAERDLDALETAAGIADAAGDVARFDELEVKRRAAAAAAVNARDEVGRIARRKRGAARLAADIDKEIVVLAPDVGEAMAELRDVVLRAWRQKLVAAVVGTIIGGMLSVIREGFALHAAIKVPHQEHLELKVFDPIGFEDGEPGIRMMIADNRAYLGSPTGRLAERLDLSFADIPELKAIFDRLSPYAKVEEEVRTIEAMVADRAGRERLFSAPRPRPELVQQTAAVVETDEEYEARRTAERAAADRRSAERELTGIRYVTPGSGIISASRRGEHDPVNVPPAG